MNRLALAIVAMIFSNLALANRLSFSLPLDTLYRIGVEITHSDAQLKSNPLAWLGEPERLHYQTLHVNNCVDTLFRPLLGRMLVLSLQLPLGTNLGPINRDEGYLLRLTQGEECDVPELHLALPSMQSMSRQWGKLELKMDSEQRFYYFGQNFYVLHWGQQGFYLKAVEPSDELAQAYWQQYYLQRFANEPLRLSE